MDLLTDECETIPRQHILGYNEMIFIPKHFISECLGYGYGI